MTILTDIKARYPDPVLVNPDADPESYPLDGYCVGGAFCKFFGEDVRFPNSHVLAIALETYAGVSPGMSMFYARRISDSNDRGRFDTAWAWLDRALRSPQEPR